MPKRSRCDGDQYTNVSKRLRPHYAIPFQNTRRIESIQSYKSLIDASTERFRDKHLITAIQNRQRLKNMCVGLLGKGKAWHAVYVTVYSDIFRTVSNACHNKLAKERFSSLLELGYFNVRGIQARRNTIVVSASEKILLHIEKSESPRFHLWFRIDRKSSLDHHLARNGSGLIYHYQK